MKICDSAWLMVSGEAPPSEKEKNLIRATVNEQVITGSNEKMRSLSWCVFFVVSIILSWFHVCLLIRFSFGCQPCSLYLSFSSLQLVASSPGVPCCLVPLLVSSSLITSTLCLFIVAVKELCWGFFVFVLFCSVIVFSLCITLILS